MRRMGVSELETSTGYVRKLVLLPDAPDDAGPDEPEPVSPAETPDPTLDKAAETAREARSLRRRFGAGLPAGPSK